MTGIAFAKICSEVTFSTSQIIPQGARELLAKRSVRQNCAALCLNDSRVADGLWFLPIGARRLSRDGAVKDSPPGVRFEPFLLSRGPYGRVTTRQPRRIFFSPALPSSRTFHFQKT